MTTNAEIRSVGPEHPDLPTGSRFVDFIKCVKHGDSRRIGRKEEPFGRRFINAKAPVGSREWWKHVDNLSQRRSISANVTLDTKSLEELNDYFADLCTA